MPDVNVCRKTLARLASLVLPLALIALPVRAAAQTVLDARTAEFLPSADHEAMDDGVPLVTSYQLQIFRVGETVPVRVLNLGKPSAQADGSIRADFAGLLSPGLAAGVDYQARVAAVGPGGIAASDLSNVFAFSCAAPSLASAAATVSAAISTGSVGVDATPGCAWTASSGATWISISSGTPGSGPGSVAYRVAANTGLTPRVGLLTIAGLPFTITQAGGACTYAITPTSKTVNAGGEVLTVTVTTASTCPWTAASNAAWITIPAGAGGTGSGTVAVTAARNTATTQRIGTATIAGRTFTATQPGACTYTITPASLSVSPLAASGSFSVVTTGACSWAPTGMPAWMTMARATRTGSGSLAWSVTANTGNTRTATLRIGGQSIGVTQASGTPPTAPANLRFIGIGSQ